MKDKKTMTAQILVEKLKIKIDKQKKRKKNPRAHPSVHTYVNCLSSKTIPNPRQNLRILLLDRVHDGVCRSSLSIRYLHSIWLLILVVKKSLKNRLFP